MPFNFAPLYNRIDLNNHCIKPELFFQVGSLIKDVYYIFDRGPLTPRVAASLSALAQSARIDNGHPTQYVDLYAILDSDNFKTMATGTDQQASHLHFRQSLRVLEVILEEIPKITEINIILITNLLNRMDLHRTV